MTKLWSIPPPPPPPKPLQINDSHDYCYALEKIEGRNVHTV